MRRALALLTLALIAGCTTRERANPLDPRNPSTGGRPAGFQALAEDGQVLLQWTPMDPRLVSGFLLERTPEGVNGFIQIGPIFRPSDGSFLDLAVLNGVTYHYRLSYTTIAGKQSPFAEDLASPSPVIPWVAEAGRRSLVRLTADGRHIALEEPGFDLPSNVAVDRARHNVWLVDNGAGQVVLYLPSIGARVSIPGFQDPGIAAVDRLSGDSWVSDYTAGLVRHLAQSGNPSTPPAVGGTLLGPLGVDVDPQSGVLWVCERIGGTVRRFKSDGTALGTTSLASPSRVSVDSANGEAWVSSFETGRVVHFEADGAAHDTIAGFHGPVGVAVDPYRSRVWVADPVAGEVVALHFDGSTEFRVGGLSGPVELAVETGSGEAWAVVTGAIVRISPPGSVVMVSSGLSDPASIALDRFGP